MTRAPLLLAIVTFVLAATQQAWCRPPDQVPYSPVPPLETASSGNVMGVVPAPTPPTDDGKPQVAPLRSGIDAEPWSATSISSEQRKYWDSPEMVEARQAVMDFCRRSAQTSPAEGEKFLAKLSQRSPEEMREWLERFQARRANAMQGQDAEHRARQLKVDDAVRRQETGRQAGENAAALRSQASASPPQLPWSPPLLLPTRHPPFGGPPSKMLSYDPLEAVVDPMSPRGFRRRMAAAASLPGDLPRDDPRNFIRGEEGVDFGEGANTREAVQPRAVGAPGNAGQRN